MKNIGRYFFIGLCLVGLLFPLPTVKKSLGARYSLAADHDEGNNNGHDEEGNQNNPSPTPNPQTTLSPTPTSQPNPTTTPSSRPTVTSTPKATSPTPTPPPDDKKQKKDKDEDKEKNSSGFGAFTDSSRDNKPKDDSKSQGSVLSNTNTDKPVQEQPLKNTEQTIKNVLVGIITPPKVFNYNKTLFDFYKSPQMSQNETIALLLFSLAMTGSGIVLLAPEWTPYLQRNYSHRPPNNSLSFGV